MDILISANEKIISMMTSKENNISSNMTESEYMQWLQQNMKERTEDEHRNEEISI